MNDHPALALALAAGVADQLAHPDTAPAAVTADATRQHLAHGPVGIALLHIERAAAGFGPWQRAHDWLAAATRRPFTSGADSHPFYGAPALAHVLACAAEHLPGTYQRALDLLDGQVTHDARRRLDTAHRRIDAGHLPTLGEFDAIRGLTGYGRYLLRRDPGPVLRAILHYCVRLSEPVTHDSEVLPGWWTSTGPSGRPDHRFPGGHANHGMAHGIGAALALLALSARQGVTVTGHHQAMRTILAWLARWKTDTGRGPAWPYWITRDELRAQRLAPTIPRRPSWCYGTAGQARAQQLAALALGDAVLRAQAEHALLDALTDPVQRGATADAGLCHGFAGLAHLAVRTAADAAPETAEQLRAILPALLSTLLPPGTAPDEAATALVNDPTGPGLLDGAAGTALGVLAAAGTEPPRTAWDACLLIT
ncbi:lanthionine synthetase C family protein [Streptomyces sp. NBC_00838]|uniref:lanthionine synthetase C family protein n=1 Tax=Streptomyces sp. NBC_00838 TaxID=2903680 RepID=UPI003864DFC3|nr:lanthionine synthetase C family protein [Streptomyces sp. NBC_00838]